MMKAEDCLVSLASFLGIAIKISLNKLYPPGIIDFLVAQAQGSTPRDRLPQSLIRPLRHKRIW